MLETFSAPLLALFATSLWETVLMVGISGGVAAVLGVPLGVYLHLTGPSGVIPQAAINRVVGTLVNAVRSTPFIILLVAVIPLTRLITGSSIGTAAAVVLVLIGFVQLVQTLGDRLVRSLSHK